MRKRLILFLLIIGFITNSLAASEKLNKIQQAIQKKNANWHAADTRISRMSSAEFRQLLGTYTDHVPLDIDEKMIELPQVENLPPSLDWREKDGNWVTTVKNQGGCGSCWDFSAVGQIEAWWKIHYDYPDSNINLSEQYILSCGSEAGSCEGGWPYAALEFVKNNALPHEKYMPYQYDDSVPCDNVQPGWEETAVTIPGWGYITNAEAQVINIKNALMHHPVSASYDVYEDFSYYDGGVYEHTWGEYEGGHAILIVGWEDETQSWICKNSWGPNWGEKGYFRIKWGSCNMGRYIPFIYDEMVSNPSVAISADSVTVTMKNGEHHTETINLTNNGENTVDVYTIDSQNPVLFHPSSFYAYDGRSWWCGIKSVGGYTNQLLQYLETPEIDLTGSVSPLLTFMAKWSIEMPAGANAPYDGWDGWNVWISTDNGENYAVISPESPTYSNDALWSFGHPDQGWNMGTSVKGWSGFSNQWESISFDLSEYAGEKIKLRFAFASDAGYSTPNDPGLEGLFLDNIALTDNSDTLFFNDAENQADMTARGFGTLENKWLDIYYADNQVEPGESIPIDLNFYVPDVAGMYTGDVQFFSNNDLPLPTLPIELSVTPPEDDLAIDHISGIESHLSIIDPITINVTNNGEHTHNNIPLTLEKLNDNWSVQKEITQIRPGEMVAIRFGVDTKEPTPLIASLNIDDDISSNNRDTIYYDTSTLLDNFERFNPAWQMTDNFQIPPQNAKSGQYCLAIGPDSTGALVYNEPLDISDYNLVFEFFAKNHLDEISSILYFDFSYDKTNWIYTDSVTIESNRYSNNKKQVNIVPDYKKEKIYFRIRSHQPQGNSIYLDYLMITPFAPNALTEEPLTVNEFQLMQNYPNPFNPMTKIQYHLPQKTSVTLAVYDVNGRLIEKLVDKQQVAGRHQVSWNAANYSSGLYFYRIRISDRVKTRKMILMK